MVGGIYKVWDPGSMRLALSANELMPKREPWEGEFTRGPVGGSRRKRSFFPMHVNGRLSFRGLRGYSGQYVTWRSILFCSRWDPSKKAPVFSQKMVLVRSRTGVRCYGRQSWRYGPQVNHSFAPQERLARPFVDVTRNLCRQCLRFVCDLWNK